jgi:O-acetyl-ADP-ribose deacetylase (regulator of RNase III)
MSGSSPRDAAVRRLECARGDLTRERVDAIVNAANSSLRGGGGVDGAIHASAGPGLLAECVARWPDGCPTGEARITAGHALPARYVIHAVGPVWRGGGHGERALLASAYASSLALAAEHGCATVSFPALSAGAYGYPWPEAAEVAVLTLLAGLAAAPSIERARLVLFGDEIFEVFRSAERRLGGGE